MVTSLWVICLCFPQSNIISTKISHFIQIPNIYLGLGFEFEFRLQRIRDLAIACLKPMLMESSCHFGIEMVACHFQSWGSFFFKEIWPPNNIPLLPSKKVLPSQFQNLYLSYIIQSLKLFKFTNLVEVSCHFGIGIVACHFQSLGNFFYREPRFVAFLFLEFSAKTLVLAKLYKTENKKSENLLWNSSKRVVHLSQEKHGHIVEFFR